MSVLKKIINNTNNDVSFASMEYRNDYGTVAKKTTVSVNIAFPWVDNERQFARKVLVFEVIGLTRIYLWESHDYHWCSVSADLKEGPFTAITNITIPPEKFLEAKMVSGTPYKGDKQIAISLNNQIVEIIVNPA